ncbi:endonuclease domain-containing protein [Pseudoxanthomonas sangjuensis]|uniref:endonuclease domain-containing protein n=1 Tax=Pseudoxanthomonas sangjuensis TaxID=1503750 RepID=UPI001FEAC311|nr:endonuclease domain-containing protein [Pseudoxanthomonas sangjuensis]
MTIVKPPLPSGTLENSRRLRRESTDAEHKLWQHLRGGRLAGLKFRRQHPVPPYIADFCCVEKKLIVELDGSQHTLETDAARTRYLETQGWCVQRFWDHDVLLQTEAVVDAIWNLAGKPDPHPNPSPDGRGAQRHDAHEYD